MPSEVEIGGQTYRIGQLNAVDQFNIARRLAPVIAKLAASDGGGTPLNLAIAIAALSDEECKYIMHHTLKIMHRKVGDQWAVVWNTQVDLPQFADITGDMLITLVLAVVQDQLGSFTPGLAGLGTAPSSTAPNARLN